MKFRHGVLWGGDALIIGKLLSIIKSKSDFV
jgi:hypothetical protein